jgi:tRNA-Thr(GGU) m(6)t(6)A37 methyltransferase TsaA
LAFSESSAAIRRAQAAASVQHRDTGVPILYAEVMTDKAISNEVMREGAPAAREGIREGEVQVVLPERYDAHLYFIGRIRTPWTNRKDCPRNPRQARERGETCIVEVDPRYADALKGVAGCSHLIILYWMHESRRDLVQQKPRHAEEPHGTFSLRSPARPNPIALSVVDLVKVEGTALTVLGLDCLDGTALVDIKPYFASTDSFPDAVSGARK